MSYFIMQIAILLTAAMVGGIFLGRWLANLRNKEQIAECRVEQDSLRQGYNDAIKENTVLRVRVKQAEEALQKLGSSELNEADYGKYLQARKELETARKQYGELLETCQRQGRVLKQLEHEAKKQPSVCTCEVDPASKKTNVSSRPVTHSIWETEEDDLTRIQGVNSRLASTLRALGIMTYRQIAEFTHDDIRNIQHIIGSELNVPLEGWIQEARQLFQQKQSPA